MSKLDWEAKVSSHNWMKLQINTREERNLSALPTPFQMAHSRHDKTRALKRAITRQRHQEKTELGDGANAQKSILGI